MNEGTQWAGSRPELHRPGEATSAQAREALLAVFGQPSPELLQDANLSLRSWAWKALNQCEEAAFRLSRGGLETKLALPGGSRRSAPPA